MTTIKHPDGSTKLQRLAKASGAHIATFKCRKGARFSLITKNKTKFRSNLKLDDTLSSILIIKQANSAPCQDYKPPKVLESARKATMAHNI